MRFADQLPTWIERTRSLMDPPIPPNLTHSAAPWLADAVMQIYSECGDDGGALQSATDTCEQTMLAAGDDLSARFVVLYLFYRLEIMTLPDGPEDDEHDEEMCKRAFDAFAHLVSVLPVEDCPRTWPRVRWEITTAYAAGLGKRAADLYDFAERESIIAVRDARLMRGHFRYLLAHAGGFKFLANEDGAWEPQVLGSKDPSLQPPENGSSVTVAMQRSGTTYFNYHWPPAVLFGNAVAKTWMVGPSGGAPGGLP